MKGDYPGEITPHPGHLVDDAAVDAICDVGDRGRAIIASTEFTSQSEYNPRRGRRVGNILNDMFEEEHFNGKRVLELGPGHYAFALLARHLGAEVICVERDPAFVALGRHLGFEVFEQNFYELEPESFARQFDGLWAKGVFNACGAETDADVGQFVERVSALLGPDGWGWFISSNKIGQAPRGWTVEGFVAHRVERQRAAFMGLGWTAYEVPERQRSRYAVTYANSPYLFVRSLEPPGAQVVHEGGGQQRHLATHGIDSYDNTVVVRGRADERDPAHPAPDASRRFNKAFRAWQPHAVYLEDPWGYFVRFVDITKTRGARFITMSQALAGDYDESEINVLLDHHIDFYPLETEVMCRWELENDVVSSVYLFNRTETTHTLQKKVWRVEDLNISFYQQLERSGFEIGYHQNAVGSARYRLRGTRGNRSASTGKRLRAIDPELEELALAIFAEDVSDLRRYFDIRTFIPHGAGEDNHQLRTTPPGCEDLVWVYNNAGGSMEGRPPLRWKNFSDSSGVRPTPIRAFGARHLAYVDKLHLKAHLLTPGLNHVLLHPGRYSRGMPYEKLSEPEKVNECVYEQFPFVGLSHRDLPLRVQNLVARWEGQTVDAPKETSVGHAVDELGYSRVLPADGSRNRYVMSDEPHVLRERMGRDDGCVPILVFHSALGARELAARKLPSGQDPSSRRVQLPREAAPQKSDQAFMEAFRLFINEVHSDDIVKHLARAKLPIRALHLAHCRVVEEGAFKFLAQVLDGVDPQSDVYVRVAVDRTVNLQRLPKSLMSALGRFKWHYADDCLIIESHHT